MIFKMKIEETEYNSGIEFDPGSVGRQPLANGHLGQAGFTIAPILVTRLTPLGKKGAVQFDDSLLKLMAATGEEAYFKGELTLAYPGDPGNITLKLNWETGHICAYSFQPTAEGIVERITISAPDVTINNSHFSGQNAARAN